MEQQEKVTIHRFRVRLGISRLGRSEWRKGVKAQRRNGRKEMERGRRGDGEKGKNAIYKMQSVRMGTLFFWAPRNDPLFYNL